MPLKPQTTELPITWGLDESTNEEGAPNGFTVLENCVWQDKDSVTQRPGFRRVATWESDGHEHGLIAAGNALLVGKRTYSDYLGLSPGTLPVHPITHRTMHLDWGSARVRQCDSAIGPAAASELLCVAWSSWSEGASNDWDTETGISRSVTVRIIDHDSGVVAREDQFVGNCDSVRVVQDPFDGWHVFFLEGAISTAARTLKRARYSSASPTSAPSVTTITTDVYGDPDGKAVYCACRGNTDVFAAWGSDATGTLVVHNASTNSSAAALAGTTPRGSMDMHCNSSIFIGYVASSGDVEGVTYTEASPPVNGNRTESTVGPIVAVTGQAARDVGVCFADGIGGDDLWVSVTSVEPGTGVLQGSWTPGNAPNPQYTILGTRLIARPRLNVDNTDIVVAVTPLSSDVGLYGIGQLVNARTAEPVAVLCFDEIPQTIGSGSILATIYPGISTLNVDPLTNKVVVSLPVTLSGPDAGQTGTAIGNKVGVNRVRTVELQYTGQVGEVSPAGTLRGGTQMNGVAFIPGSLTQTFDGQWVLPAAFVAQPLPPTATPPGPGPFLYSYQVVEEYADRLGNTQLSPPSPLVTAASAAAVGVSTEITIDGDIISDGLNIDVAGLRRRIRVYRTVAGGATMYLLRQFYTLSSSWTFEDDVTDDILSESGVEVLYTTGALASELAPPTTALVAHGNRLFGISADDARIIRFTQETQDAVLPRWNSVLQLRVDNSGGVPLALASMDDKLLIIQENQTVAITGPGPDGQGTGSFSVPEIVAGNMGVSFANINSVVSVPEVGVFFRHKTGIKLLSRNLEVVDIGQSVQRLLGNRNIVRARFLPSLHQVWFIQEPSDVGVNFPILVFDVRFNRWSSFDAEWLGAIVDVEEVGGVVYVLDIGTDIVPTNARLYVHTGYGDLHEPEEGLVPVMATLGLPWFRGNGKNGDVRLWRAAVSGQIAPDADSGTTASLSSFSQRPGRAPANPSVADSTFSWTTGQFDDWTPQNGFRLEARLVTQRAQSFRVEFRFLCPPSDTSPGLFITHVTYEWGAEGGKGKTPLARKPTVT